MKIQLTSFVQRQWDKKFAGTKIDIWQADFIKLVNDAFDDMDSIDPEFTTDFKDSQNDFCKYFFIENAPDLFPTVKKAVIKIDHTIYPYIQSGYSSRTAEELAVLSRWVSFPPKIYPLPTAEWIGFVLYTREQLLKEHNAQFPPEDYKSNTPWSDKTVLMQPTFELTEECEYGIVAIMGLGQPEMDPMPPITHVRNALGTAEGGNGVAINKEEYEKSVKFWSEHILVK